MSRRIPWLVADSEHVHRPRFGRRHPHLAAEVAELADHDRDDPDVVAELTRNLTPSAAARARSYKARTA